MSIKIDHHVPLPEARGKYTKYPFGSMKVGDSFAVVSGDETTCVRQAASHYARRSGKKMKFSIMKNGAGHRCWRIE